MNIMIYTGRVKGLVLRNVGESPGHVMVGLIVVHLLQCTWPQKDQEWNIVTGLSEALLA